MPGQETNDHGKPKEVEHEERHAHRVVSTAKLVVTFSAAIAATFVAAAMQVEHDVSVFDDVAALFMLVALGFTIRVVMLPTRPSEGPSSRFGLRLPVPLREHKPTTEDPDEDKRVTRAKELSEAAHNLMVWQVWISSASCFVAAIGMLAKDWGWVK